MEPCAPGKKFIWNKPREKSFVCLFPFTAAGLKFDSLLAIPVNIAATSSEYKLVANKRSITSSGVNENFGNLSGGKDALNLSNPNVLFGTKSCVPEPRALTTPDSPAFVELGLANTPPLYPEKLICI